MRIEDIVVRGAREHNLKGIDINLPRDKFIVLTGVSGSGKSSLAFDTIYAEGQRRYVESLSAYARQFLGQMEKPDVDYIEGLSPAISIEQKTTHRNPRSTVGTVTEIYDYLRLLYARCGKAYCPKCGLEVEKQSVDRIVESIYKLPVGTKLMLLSPVVRGRKGSYKKELENIRQGGFVRVRIDGKLLELEDEIKLAKNKKHDIDIVLDRVVIRDIGDDDLRERITEGVESGLEISGGLLTISYEEEGGKDEGRGADKGDGKRIGKREVKSLEKVFSEHLACAGCDISFPELEPRTFSFNSPEGACIECKGLGENIEFSEELVLPDKSKSILGGGIAVIRNVGGSAWYALQFKSLSKHYKFSLSSPLNELDEEVLKTLLYGSGDEELLFRYMSKDGKNEYMRKSHFEGIIPMLGRRYSETTSESAKRFYEGFMRNVECSRCGGKRLKEEVLGVKVEGLSIMDFTYLSIEKALQFVEGLELSGQRAQIANSILKEIRSRLLFLKDVGLGYLSLSRKAGTLSGGEMQRIRLATQIGSQLVGVLYVLDEPSIGLHQKDNQKLIETLKKLKDLGNTLLVVEHDAQTILSADYVVDLGPGAGLEGGEVTAKGTSEDIKSSKSSLTGDYLSGRKRIELEERKRIKNGDEIVLKGCSANNLKGVDVRFPLSKFIVVTGVSGSGKSTLINHTLYPALKRVVMGEVVNEGLLEGGGYKSIEGIENIDKVISIDQSPIGRTTRSNPATYTGLFTPIRELFSMLNESKAKGYKMGRFSFNVKGGRCETCGGYGTRKIEMHFLADVYVTCEQCKGKRYNKETLSIRYKGKNIAEVLDLTIDQGLELFENIPGVKTKLKTLKQVGLGYMKLGQSATTLSGGEAQRVKLASELSKRHTGRTFYLLDEPTTGLHFDDIKKLVIVLNELVSKGNTVLVIEHNMDVIKLADHIIDLGPAGGDGGGEIVCYGTPYEVSKRRGGSATGEYLSREFEGMVLA